MNARHLLDRLVEDQSDPKLPRAWMGYKATHAGIFVRVCAHCPDKAQAEAEAKKAGLAVTHSICPECAQREFGIRLGERPA